MRMDGLNLAALIAARYFGWLMAALAITLAALWAADKIRIAYQIRRMR